MGLGKAWWFAEDLARGLREDKEEGSHVKVVAAGVAVEVAIGWESQPVFELLPEILLIKQRRPRVCRDIPSAARICDMSDMVALCFRNL